MFLSSLDDDKEPTCRPRRNWRIRPGLYFWVFVFCFLILFFGGGGRCGGFFYHGVCSIYKFENTTFYFGKDFLNFCLANGMHIGNILIFFVKQVPWNSGLVFYQPGSGTMKIPSNTNAFSAKHSPDYWRNSSDDIQSD